VTKPVDPIVGSECCPDVTRVLLATPPDKAPEMMIMMRSGTGPQSKQLPRKPPKKWNHVDEVSVAK